MAELQSPTTTTIPSTPVNNAEPTSKDETPGLPPESARLKRLRILVYRLLYQSARAADRILVRLSSVLSTPSGTDALLSTFGYTLELLHAILSRTFERRLTDIATDMAEKAEGVLLPGETLIATLPAPQSTKLIAQAVGSSKALAAVIADYRIFVRMWGLLGLYDWARGTWTSPLAADAEKKDRVVRAITWAQIISLAAFQVLENGAYLASKGVLTSNKWAGEKGKRRENRWWVLSSRFWCAQVTLEGARLYVLWLYQNSDDASNREVKQDGEKEGKLLKENRREERWLWWRDVVNNVGYFPMTIHWSREEGLLTEAGVGICGLLAGGVMLADAWFKTI